MKKLALLFHLKTATAHAVCNNFTTFIAAIRARFATEQLPAAFAPVILFFTSAYEMLTGALLYQLVTAVFCEQFKVRKFKTAVWIVFRGAVPRESICKFRYDLSIWQSAFSDRIRFVKTATFGALVL